MQLNYKNATGDVLDLLGNRDYFVLIGADNLHGIDLDYSESDSPYIDGTTVDNVRALPRGIVLTFQLVGDVPESIARFTSIVKSKQIGTLQETDDNGRTVQINGVAKVPPYTRLLSICTIQLELYCGQPYWEDIATIIHVISSAINLLYMPESGRAFPSEGVPFGALNSGREQTIPNVGDTSVGMIINIIATSVVNMPRISCTTGTQNGWYMELNLEMQANDEIVISTVRGNKYITYNGSQYYGDIPIVSLLTVNGDDWLQLEQGDNTFNITASNDAISFYVGFKRRYE